MGKCLGCAATDGYTLLESQTQCQLCSVDRGIVCAKGLASVRFGYWGFVSDGGRVLQTAACLPEFCRGGDPPRGICAPNRRPDFPGCGQCDDGFVGHGTQPVCVPCTQSNGSWIFLLLLFSWLFAMVVLYLSTGKQTAELKVLLFFTSSARIILGPASGWLSAFVLLENGLQSALGVGISNTCIFALSPYQMGAVQMLWPFVGIGELMLTTAGVRFVSWLWPQRVEFQANMFIRAGIALCTFR